MTIDHHTRPQASRPRAALRDCCEEACPAGARNNYFLGKQLTPDSFRLEQAYGMERRRLLNRALYGWGVVYGFALDDRGGAGELAVGEGLALDELGRELIQARGATLTLDDIVVLDERGQPIEAEDCGLEDRLAKTDPREDDCWLFAAHYAERTLGPVTLRDPCSCDRQEWDQTCETIVFSLRRIDCEDCCRPWHCELSCDCAPDTPCCGEHAHRDNDGERQALEEELRKRISEAGEDKKRIAELREEYARKLAALGDEDDVAERAPHGRGGCACLCEHLTGLTLGDDCVRLREVGACTRADLAHPVPLACLRLARDECGTWSIAGVADACGPRRLVKRNDLLFDLINGCDVTRIVEVGWPWGRRQVVPFDDFLAALGWPGDERYSDQPTRDFWVRFSRPVRIDSLGPEIFSMTVTSDHNDDFWRQEYRVPILSVDTDAVAAEPGDPDGHARSARIVVATAWLRNTATDDDTIFAQGETRVEIRFFGDLVEDCLGQTVDANRRGRARAPSGSDGPGDTYLSTFTVGQRAVPTPTETRPTNRGRRPTAAAS